MKQSIQKFFRMVLLFFHSLKYDRHYRKVEKMNGIINRSVDGEKEWRKKWSKLGVMTSNLQYRVFSRYIGPNINWKSHATLTLLAKQDCPLWLQYD